MNDIFSIAFNLFILMDSIGNVPIFIAQLKDVPLKRQKIVIFRELFIALILILAFNMLGDYFLDLLQVSREAVMISGGVILFLIAIKMIFPVVDEGKNHVSKLLKEPFIVPLAVPLVAGPAVIAAVMLYSKRESQLTMFTAILCAWALSTVILLSAATLKKVLGTRGIMACERLMGLILTLIAVQMFLEGLRVYASS